MTQDRKDPSQDSLPATGQPSGEQVSIPSDSEEMDVFIADEVWAFADYAARRRLGELQSQASVSEKWLGLADYELEQHKGRITELQSDLEELKKGGGDIAEIQAKRQELRLTKQELEREKHGLQWAQAEHQELFERANKFALEENAKQIAEEFGIKPDTLMDQPTPEAMRTLAQKLAEVAQSSARATAHKPDSGTGGVPADWRSLTPEQKILKGIEASKKK